MTELKTFEFMPGMTLRVTGDAENPWFVAKDVCDALDVDTSHVRRALDEDEVMTANLAGNSRGNPNKLCVSESGLYALVMKSRKPEAKAFRKWVTSVVLPAIRKDGRAIHRDERTQAEDEIVQTALHILHRRVQEITATIHGLDDETE